MISIIVPIYNTEKYLRMCVDSILSQTYKDIELVLVDDGSTDDSGMICDEYAKQDCRVKVVHKKNGGLVSARKAGLDVATGELVTAVDSDDWLDSNMLERLYEVMIRERVDIVICGNYADTGDVHIQSNHNMPAGRYDKQTLIEKVYPNMICNGGFFRWGIFPSIWAKLFKRECYEGFQRAVDDRVKMGEDSACVYPAILGADSIYVLHECLYHYRQHTASMSRKSFSKDVSLERERSNALYTSAQTYFEVHKNVYDLRNQWKDCVLYLMGPRIGVIPEYIEKLDYLFPYKGVKKRERVVIYGMGIYGQMIYKFVEDTGFCELVACADKNHEEISKTSGVNVIAPDEIANYDYDAIVISCKFENTSRDVYNDLASKYPAEKIHMADRNVLRSEVGLRAFGFIDLRG